MEKDTKETKEKNCGNCEFSTLGRIEGFRLCGINFNKIKQKSDVCDDHEEE